MTKQTEFGHDGPSFDPIERIHRDDDSYVAFMKMVEVIRDGEKKKEVLADCCVRAGSLRDVFPQFRAEFDANDGNDYYYSLHSFFRPRSGVWWKSMGLPRADRHKRNAQRLNVAFADLDGYKVGLNFGDVVGRLISMQDDGLIPPVSMYVRSGQGAWCIWYLIDRPGSHMPPTAHTHRMVLWDAIQQAVHDRVAEIGADIGAKDASRVCRVPGSFNPKSGTRVTYLCQFAADGREFEYTMEDLSNGLGVKTRTPKPSSPSTPRPKDYRVKAAQRDRARRLRLADFRLLRQVRGHFSDGCRNAAALIYAWLLHTNGYDEESIKYEVTRLARECDPPLTDDRIKAAIKSSTNISKMSDRTIANKLFVTPDEAKEIYRFSAMPIGVPILKVSVAERKRQLLNIVNAAGRDLSLHDIQIALARKGISVSKPTLSRDLRAVFGPRATASLQADLLPDLKVKRR